MWQTFPFFQCLYSPVTTQCLLPVRGTPTKWQDSNRGEQREGSPNIPSPVLPHRVCCFNCYANKQFRATMFRFIKAFLKNLNKFESYFKGEETVERSLLPRPLKRALTLQSTLPSSLGIMGNCLSDSRRRWIYTPSKSTHNRKLLAIHTINWVLTWCKSTLNLQFNPQGFIERAHGVEREN